MGQVDKLLNNTDFGRVKVKDFMIGQSFENAKKYLDNNVALENIDPHAIFPTSISRVCDGFTMATPTSQTIEAVMSTTLTTSIKITRNVLETDNKILAEIYRPLGRCVAVIDDKVEGYFGKQISEYFSANKIELVKLVHAGNEVNKDVQNVEQILLEMKKHGVSRNEPVLIVGGKVVTLECYENIAKVAQKIFDKSTVKNKIELVVGTAADEMTNMVEKGDKFDLIFIDADKENYIEYYEIGLKLLAKGGIMLADNSLCALLYDQEGDMRSTRLHLFNQHVKNDPRTEQVILTMREGITLIKPVVV